MTKKKLPVRFTGQHFTIDKVLIEDAIKQANINSQDTVLDIGAGKGFLTVHLLKIANIVVAIENDTALVEYLRKLFSDARNVQIVGCDFRNFAVPKFPFKVVSNIPYGITSDIWLYRYCPWMRGMATSQISCNNGIDKKASHVPL